jgi:carboxylesterase type B
MRRNFFNMAALTGLLITSPVFAAPPPAPVVADKPAVLEAKNVFKCQGTDPYMKQDYSGLVTISRSGDVYNLQMDYDTGEKAQGTGILHDSELSVVFRDANNPSNMGIQIYKITDRNKKMEGQWAYINKPMIGFETCEKK